MNKRAFEAVKDFVKAALEMTEKRNDLINLPAFAGLSVVFTDEGEKWELKSKIEYWRILSRQYDELMKIPEAINALNVLGEEEILKTTDLSDFRAFSELMNVLLDYFERNTFELIEHEIEESYKKYEEIWLLDKYECRLSIPLVGFKSDLDKINLPNGFTIEQLTSEEKTRLFPRFDPHFTFVSIPELADCDFVLVTNFQSEHKNPFIPTELAIEGGKCITALRLLSPGKTGAAGIFARSIYDCAGYNAIYSASVPDFRLPARRLISDHGGYHLKANMVERFLNLISILSDLQFEKQLRHLDLGLRRFNQSYSREGPEDKIIDLVIALENSLLSNVREELAYRLRIRGAVLLSTNRKAEQVASSLGALYRVRSRIVHEGFRLKDIINERKQKKKIKLPSGVTWDKFYDHSEQIVREVLVEYLTRLDSNTSIDDISRSLDLSLLQNL
jgi:hypothetical protein